VLKDGTNWSEVTGFIDEDTRSGKSRRRFNHYMGCRKFTISMRFTPSEYTLFTNWYNDTLLRGFFSFYFPMVDSVGRTSNKIYRFVNAPSYTNTKYNYVDCNMTWEQVE